MVLVSVSNMTMRASKSVASVAQEKTLVHRSTRPALVVKQVVQVALGFAGIGVLAGW